MPRELLFLDDAPITGGAEMFALRLARWIAAERPEWRTTIACPGDSDFARVCSEAGVPVIPTAFPDLVPAAAARMPAATRAVAGLLRDAGARDALVVANTARAQAYAAVAGLLVRDAPAVVNLVHEQDTAARRSARAVFKRSGRVVAVGANNAATYRAALPGMSVTQLNNFLDPDVLARAGAPGGEREQPGQPALGVLARLVPEKGVIELLNELAAVSERWSTLYLAGDAQDPAYASAVEQRIQGLGLSDRITLGGHVSDLDGFFTKIDVLVVPSTGNEGQPTVILEALAHCRPVVVRRPVWSPDFTGFPVMPYTSAAELGEVLAEPAPPAPPAGLAERFGPEQALAALVAAAA